MAAVERRFSEPVPEQLYLDTDILISHVVGSQPHHERCRLFLERLAQEGRTKIYLSPLSWLEFVHVFRGDLFRSALPEAQQQQYRLRRWTRDAEVRKTYLQDMLASVEQLLADFEWYEIPITPAVRVAACALVAAYNLGGQDALHLACAAEEQIIDLASLDKDYRRVDGLILWNDLIHSESRS